MTVFVADGLIQLTGIKKINLNCLTQKLGRPNQNRKSCFIKLTSCQQYISGFLFLCCTSKYLVWTEKEKVDCKSKEVNDTLLIYTPK